MFLPHHYTLTSLPSPPFLLRPTFPIVADIRGAIVAEDRLRRDHGLKRAVAVDPVPRQGPEQGLGQGQGQGQNAEGNDEDDEEGDDDDGDEEDDD